MGRPPGNADHVREERDRRVDLIVSRMAGGRWFAGRSARKLAKTWGVNVHTVHDYAREASGILRRAYDASSAEELRAMVLAGYDAVMRMAMQRKGYSLTGDSYPNPDLKAMLGALDGRAKLLGLITQKHDVTQSEAWAKLPEDEKRARLEHFERAIAQERQRLALNAKGEKR